MAFDSYHWLDADFADPALDDARAELAEPTSEDAARSAFVTLLEARQPAARGVAFDHYRYAEASSRFGEANPFTESAQRVLQRARETLRQAPVEKGVHGAAVPGANHASALGPMVNLAQPEDGALIADILRTPAGPDVWAGALDAAQTVAERAPAVDPDLVGALTAAVADPARSWRDRADALGVLAFASPTAALARADAMLGVPDLRMRVRAAWVLAEGDLEANRQRLNRLVKTWPDDAPWPAFEVRQMLEDAEES